MKRFFSIVLLVFPLLFASCFSPALEDENGTEVLDPNTVRVSFSITSIEQIPFDGIDTRASIADLCSRATLAVFQEGSKVKSINQQSDDAGFGTFNLSLSPGVYEFVIIAHNGLGNCTVSSPDKITFANNKCTDTFYFYDTIEVSGELNQSVSLSRCVAMFRLHTLDDIPSNVSQMQFYYTGGSSTFSAVSGYGCVNSRQTETFSLTASQTGRPGTFEVYTFPHAETGDLKMTVTALDASQKTVAEREFNPLPVTINRITSCTTQFFTSSGGGGSSASGGVNLSIRDNGEWDGVDEID